MNIKEELFYQHNKATAVKVAEYAIQSPANMQALMNLFTGTDRLLAQRAAWSIGWAGKMNIATLQPYVKQLINILHEGHHPALMRNALCVLQDMDIPEELHGDIMNKCFDLVVQPCTPVAPKAYALSILHRLSKLYPEIQHELQLVIEERMDTETGAFRSRGRKILKALAHTPGE